MLSTLRCAAAVAACALSASTGLGQSLAGDFLFADRGVGMSSVWAPAGNDRIQHTGGSNILRVDVNENGSFSDPLDTEYVLPMGLEDGINYELSPTKKTLYVTLDGEFVCGGLQVFFLDLPPGGGAASPTHQDCLPGGLPFNGTSPEYFDTHHFGVPPPGTYTSTQRVAWMVTGANSGTPTPEVRFYDLTAPTVVASVEMSAQWNWIKIARSGNYALIKHDTDNPTGTADYLLVNLCSGPEFGTVIHQLQNVQGIPSEANARITTVSGGELTIEIFRGTQVLYSTTRPDCLAPPTETPGRCCVDGGCQYILPSACASLGGAFTAGADCSGSPCAPTGACCVGSSCSTTTLAACNTLGGSWSQGTACTPSLCIPPAPQLTLTASGTPSSAWQQPITYTFLAGNTGNASATNAQLVVYPPSGATFLSATPPPSQNWGSELRWSLGTFPAGTQQSISLTVNAPCNYSATTLYTYYVTASNGAFVNGAPAVTTTLAPESADPASITLTSSSPPAPLAPGALSTHTLEITNSSASPRTLVFWSLDPGNSAEFVEPLNPEVGTWYFYPESLSWQADFAPGQSIAISFTSRVRECINTADTSTALNDANPIAIRSSCGNVRGTTSAPATSALLHPINVTIGAAPVPGSISPVVNGSQVIDPAAPVVIDFTITNAIGATYPNAFFQFEIPAGLVVADPPFIGAVPPGLTFDALSRFVSFSGAIPPAGLAFAIAAQPDPVGSCASVITMTGGTSESCSDLAATLRLYAYAGSPTPNSMLLLGEGSELYAWDPLLEAAPRRLGCLPGNARSFDRAEDGRLFFTGTTDFMFDPVTLAITELMPIIRPQILPAENGFYFFNDLVWDETTHRLFLLAMNYSTSTGSIVRFDPVTGTAQRIISRGDFAYRYDIAIDALGRPLVPVSSGARRVDPTQPLPLDPANAAFISAPIPNHGFPLGQLYSQDFSFVGTPGGGLAVLNAAAWSQTTGGQSITWRLFSIAESNPADVFTITAPQLAWNGSAFPGPLPPRPAQFTPLIDPALIGNPRMFAMDDSRLLIVHADGAFPTTLAANIVDRSNLTTASTLLPPTLLPFVLRDVIWIKGPATCPADWNSDTGVDGDDVIAFFADWDVSNADFNNDGGTDGDDVIDFFAHWDSGC